jgi:Fe2+ transport system protein B
MSTVVLSFYAKNILQYIISHLQGSLQIGLINFMAQTLTVQSVLLCFVCLYVLCLSQSTAIFSVSNSKWLVFVMESDCVICEVKTPYEYRLVDYKNKLQSNSVITP